MFEKLKEAVERVEEAEKMALAGSMQHDMYVKAALMSAWPTIKAYVVFESRPRS